jgi:meiotic recombination protein SPO11
VLVIEKEATFSKLLSLKSSDAGYAFLDNYILVTGKGYPDVSTRLLLKLLSQSLAIFCLIDGDPHGFQIYLTYKYGSKSMAFSATNLAVPCIQFLGVAPSAWFTKLHIKTQDLIQLSINDVKKCLSLLKNPHVYLNPSLKREISRLMFTNYKSEIQSIAISDLQIFVRDCGIRSLLGPTISDFQSHAPPDLYLVRRNSLFNKK